ncbi:MAG: NYN domain-containing protein [Desulfobacterales bacterium]|nr:NYN domain-containing protein [Desulfobacterales bacterium]
MPLHIIIDGYNLIRQSNKLSPLDIQDIQLGREALVDSLSAYKSIKHHKISVVFDGQNAPSFLQHADQVKGIEIKFSHHGETADTVIKRMAAKEKEKAIIVSSDRDIVDFAASQGAATMGSNFFEEKIALAAISDTHIKNDEDRNGWVPTTRKKGPKRRLSKKKRQNMIKTRKL